MLRTLCLIFAACGGAAPALAAAASAPATSAAAGNSAATAACERATRSTLGNTRGPAVEVSFNAPPALLPGAADATEIVLRGAGRVRSASGARTFTYSCNFDTRSNEVSGVVVRDAQAAAQQAAPAARSVEPDLSNLSPTACESAAATALQRRWPRVSRIAFNPDTRSLTQDSTALAELRGQGTAQPSTDAPATHFSYQCAIDARSGRVVSARVSN